MSTVTRPQFAEGQVLAAADLLQLASYPRGREERHNRILHRWGIATGLTLETEDAETSTGVLYKKVFLTPGLAIDGEGREVLVTERVALSAERLKQELGSALNDEGSYPVFIASQYRIASRAAALSDPCGSGGGAAGAVEEGFEISFGLPGDETFEQVPAALASEPVADTGSLPWAILVGFVKWSKAAQSFADVDAAMGKQHRRHVGINAASMAGDGTQLVLHPRVALQSGDAVVRVRQDDDDGPTLVFGTYKSASVIEPLLEVSAKGDLVVKGSLTGKRTGNSVQLQSGLASDGVILPLPAGVTEGQVQADDGPAVHIQVTPVIDPAAAPDPAADYGAQVVECRVDEERRVHCLIAWTLLLGVANPPATPALEIRPGAVRYTVSVTTTEEV